MPAFTCRFLHRNLCWGHNRLCETILSHKGTNYILTRSDPRRVLQSLNTLRLDAYFEQIWDVHGVVLDFQYGRGQWRHSVLVPSMTKMETIRQNWQTSSKFSKIIWVDEAALPVEESSNLISLPLMRHPEGLFAPVNQNVLRQLRREEIREDTLVVWDVEL